MLAQVNNILRSGDYSNKEEIYNKVFSESELNSLKPQKKHEKKKHTEPIKEENSVDYDDYESGTFITAQKMNKSS